MTVQLTIPLETLLELVAQLPPSEQRDLLQQLQGRLESHTLFSEEWSTTFRAAILDRPLVEVPSLDRADWYDDDGR